MKILIVGAGGVGGYFGAHLLKTGADVTFLLRGKRYEAIKKNGLTVITPEESFVVQPKIALSEELKPEYDLIILSPKAYDLDSALSSIEKASSRGVFLPLLNGRRHIHKLDTLYGSDRVMGGLANIVATITPNGEVARMTDRHILTIGHRAGTHEKVAREFFRLCDLSKFDSVYSEDIEQALWNKWTFLATLAGLSTLFETSIGEILQAPDGGRVILGMYSEVCSVAAENQHPIPPQAQSQALELLTQPGSTLTASMMRDLKQGFQTEHDHILGDLLDLSKSKITKPYLTVAYVNMLIRSK